MGTTNCGIAGPQTAQRIIDRLQHGGIWIRECRLVVRFDCGSAACNNGKWTNNGSLVVLIIKERVHGVAVP